ncbi:MAG: cell wall hydrolase, partial [Geminicoccaceae bacterium]|nr:cell wall hydrolase [Geminicoccaceae bacterium]
MTCVPRIRSGDAVAVAQQVKATIDAKLRILHRRPAVPGTQICNFRENKIKGLLRMSWKVLAMAVTIGSSLIWTPADAQDVDAESRRMFALNMYHEARSEGREGMVAIGWVVLNRVADGKYPDSITGVITQKRGSRCEWGWWC